MKTIKASVKGMTCSSCEVLIERKLKNVPGVKKATVSLAKKEAEVECEDNVTLDQLQYPLQGTYVLSESDHRSEQATAGRKSWSEIGAVVVVLAGMYLLFKEFDLLPQGLGITDNMSYGFVFLIGLIAATSTCLAVSGGLLLGIAAKYNEKYPHLNGWQKFRPHISFNIGRIVSYTVLGAAIGLVGSALTISPKITGIITIGASMVMIVVGVQLLHIFPGLNRFQIKMPKFLAHKLHDSSENGTGSYQSSFLFGAATFFLPCGFTQALQLYVLGKGDPLIGGLTMLAFSLGTMPSLVGVGFFSSFLKGEWKRYFTTFSAVLIVVLGVWNISSGLALTGTTFFNTPSAGDATGAVIAEGKQIVEMAVQGLNYVPDRFTIKKGVPVEWRINGKGAQGCAQTLSVPQLGITERLSKAQDTIITFTPDTSGKIRFTCGMGMAGPGVFEVI